MFLIWSNEHRAWWKPGRCGYTADIAQAGLYTAEAANAICEDATMNWHQAPNEIPVRVADLPDAAQLAALTFIKSVADAT
ncbi:MAG: hypothetical protein HOO99_03995 [Hyphomicrobiaceae bacterium]|nr:hypothetical protein [Hyphomicrobiaceae bacterium]